MNAPPRVAIAGGSLGGLMAGLELLAAGADVHVFERSGRVLADRGAGIVMQPDTLRILMERCGLDEDKTGTWLRYRQYLDRSGEVSSHQAMPQLMTSWGLLYRAFRNAFPAERYHEERPLVSFTDEEDGVKASFGDAGAASYDLLVGADGSRSFIRQQLLPQIAPRYAGYVAWRGVVPEGDASESLLRAFDDHFTFQQMQGSHILCYFIPGPAGELEHGKRRLNWVWYWNVPESELSALLTGRDGKEYDFSLPPGQVGEQAITAQGAIAERVLSPQFQELWRATQEPFIQPILDLAVDRMVFGRTILLGDAAFIPRPHTAGSTAKAATNAISLGEALASHPESIGSALRSWEPSQLELGRQLEFQGMTLGDRSQFGRPL
jgi:2-polyprenyl-6-methoxyphenol hydroxylase-like FAD-dependent oxidoreductase